MKGPFLKTLGIRVSAALFAVATIATGAFGPLAYRTAPAAHAALPVIDGANLTVNATSAVQETFQTTIMNVLNGLAWVAAKTVVQSLTQSIVTWINSGFDGSPAFVTDLNRNLGNLADAVAEDFLIGLDQVAVSNTGISIRAPFQDQINAALREEFYRTASSHGFNTRYAYQNCYGDGKRFSFNGFLCESQNPANNVFGRYQLARNELFKAIDTETKNRLRELDWGKGFLSWRGNCGPYARSATSVGGANPQLGYDPSVFGTGQTLSDGTPISLSTAEKNVGCSIRTPGSVIEDQLVSTLGSPIRQLELADSINEIVGALVSQMVTQVLGGTGLSGVSQPSAGGGSSFLDQATNPGQYTGVTSSIADGFTQSISQQRAGIGTYRTNWQRIAAAALSAQQACSEARAGDASAVLSAANANITRATAALAAISNLESKIAAARAANAPSTAISEVVNEYHALLLNGTLLSEADIAEAAVESQDTGSAEPGSLYSQMVRLRSSCQ